MLGVLLARDVADLGLPDVTLGDLLDEWAASDVDLADDVRVVEDRDGRIVGYGVVRRAGTLAVVHPDHEGQGVGALLLEWAERRERERGRGRHRQWVVAANASARMLLTAASYSPVRSYWRMVCPLDYVAGADLPAGFRVRAVDVDRDAVSLHALDAASFTVRPDYVPESLTEFREEHLQSHDFDAALSRVAHRGDRIAGFLVARRWDEEAVGYVDLLAVDPAHQGRGLGTALLRSAFAGFASAGLREAQLGVDSDNPRALRLYERAGMRVRFQCDVYERAITGGPGGKRRAAR